MALMSAENLVPRVGLMTLSETLSMSLWLGWSGLLMASKNCFDSIMQWSFTGIIFFRCAGGRCSSSWCSLILFEGHYFGWSGAVTSYCRWGWAAVVQQGLAGGFVSGGQGLFNVNVMVTCLPLRWPISHFFKILMLWSIYPQCKENYINIMDLGALHQR